MFEGKISYEAFFMFIGIILYTDERKLQLTVECICASTFIAHFTTAHPHKYNETSFSPLYCIFLKMKLFIAFL